MRNLKNKLWVALVMGAVFLAVSCASGNLDEGADVVVTVQQMTIPPVAGAGDGGGGCVFTVTDATAQLESQPKSEPANTSPFNDTVINSVTISYTWDDLALVTPTRTFEVSGTVPVGGSASIMFPPIAAGDLSAAFSAHTATLSITFNGSTVSGDAVTVPAGGNLTVNACI
ncbi:MAG: hypothetical protein R3344_12895 [Acidobacteriota bacterium]|nr:hypothetical protein [Acidobacteriota bacterium]